MAKLLIVDDEKIMQDLGRSFFERRGYRVFYADRGEAGLKLFEAERPDVVLLDLGLPDMDGKDVLVKMKQINKEAKIIILTGFSGQEIKDKVAPLGADAFFTKPCRLPAIAEQLEKWIKK